MADSSSSEEYGPKAPTSQRRRTLSTLKFSSQSPNPRRFDSGGGRRKKISFANVEGSSPTRSVKSHPKTVEAAERPSESESESLPAMIPMNRNRSGNSITLFTELLECKKEKDALEAKVVLLETKLSAKMEEKDSTAAETVALIDEMSELKKKLNETEEALKQSRHNQSVVRQAFRVLKSWHVTLKKNSVQKESEINTIKAELMPLKDLNASLNKQLSDKLQTIEKYEAIIDLDGKLLNKLRNTISGLTQKLKAEMDHTIVYKTAFTKVRRMLQEKHLSHNATLAQKNKEIEELKALLTKASDGLVPRWKRIAVQEELEPNEIDNPETCEKSMQKTKFSKPSATLQICRANTDASISRFNLQLHQIFYKTPSTQNWIIKCLCLIPGCLKKCIMAIEYLKDTHIKPSVVDWVANPKSLVKDKCFIRWCVSATALLCRCTYMVRVTLECLRFLHLSSDELTSFDTCESLIVQCRLIRTLEGGQKSLDNFLISCERDELSAATSTKQIEDLHNGLVYVLEFILAATDPNSTVAEYIRGSSKIIDVTSLYSWISRSLVICSVCLVEIDVYSLVPVQSLILSTYSSALNALKRLPEENSIRTFFEVGGVFLNLSENCDNFELASINKRVAAFEIATGINNSVKSQQVTPSREALENFFDLTKKALEIVKDLSSAHRYETTLKPLKCDVEDVSKCFFWNVLIYKNEHDVRLGLETSHLIDKTIQLETELAQVKNTLNEAETSGHSWERKYNWLRRERDILKVDAARLQRLETEKYDLVKTSDILRKDLSKHSETLTRLKNINSVLTYKLEVTTEQLATAKTLFKDNYGNDHDSKERYHLKKIIQKLSSNVIYEKFRNYSEKAWFRNWDLLHRLGYSTACEKTKGTSVSNHSSHDNICNDLDDIMSDKNIESNIESEKLLTVNDNNYLFKPDLDISKTMMQIRALKERLLNHSMNVPLWDLSLTVQGNKYIRDKHDEERRAIGFELKRLEMKIRHSSSGGNSEVKGGDHEELRVINKCIDENKHAVSVMFQTNYEQDNEQTSSLPIVKIMVNGEATGPSRCLIVDEYQLLDIHQRIGAAYF